MSAGIFAAALKEFELALEELASNLEFVNAAKQLRPRLGNMLDWQNMDNEAKKLAKLFLEQRAVEESLLYRGMVVSLSGAFEQFVRRILRDSVLAINGAAENYDSIHEEIRKQNAYRTGIALQTIFEPPDYLELDYELLARNMGTCFIGAEKVVLNADAFTIFLSIISPEKITDALKRIGMKMNWDALGAMQAMRRAVEKNDTRETAKALQESLKRFGRTRNKIAHSGSGGVVVTESDLRQLLKFFRTFSGALIAFVETELRKLVGK